MEDQEQRHKIAERIFEYWKVRTGHPRARLDVKRRQKINQRLADGYTEQDIIDAIEGCVISPFHNGTERRVTSERYSPTAVYNDLELILRDAKHVDQFIKIHDRHVAHQKQQAALARQKAEEDARLVREREERARTPFRHGSMQKPGTWLQ